MSVPAMPDPVADVYAGYPEAARTLLGTLRGWTFEEADLAGASPLTETLKWGEPAYLTQATRAGTTLRLAWSKKSPSEARMLVHCQTSLIETWRDRFGDTLTFDGNRAVRLPLDAPLAEEPLRICIAMALTYHRAHP